MTVSLAYKHAGSIAFTALYVMCNSLSLGPLPFLVTAEVLPEDIKARGISVTTFINWLCNLLVGIGFPVLAHYTGNYTFVPFTCLLVAFWLSVFVLLPETRDQTNEQIQQAFANQVGLFASFKKSKKLDEHAVTSAADVRSSCESRTLVESSNSSTSGSSAATPAAPTHVLMRAPRRPSIDFVMPMTPLATAGLSRTA